ncbi:hypothetical protein ABW06_03185 [Pluralibacter gergoviae]|uniref:Uncharacterized protein n=1 Tax=Pluralibacter gergoviae TaxID=61647 RepID=A0A0J5L7E9_PLUGE|nr:hypothetical protein ABW06_03185 [Pluralibacter gergoviae]KMK26192.1 hypothetical protein ABW10_05670 [Pluralibacter gergoviae]MBL3692903.1 hypothetical protein [Pluralibacter gergoviae]
MKSQKCAQRRHHAARLKAKRRYYYNAGEGRAVTVGKVCQMPFLCSCWMCSHRRKHHGAGMQERHSSEPYS